MLEEYHLAEAARRPRNDSQQPRRGEGYTVPKRLLGYAKKGAVDPAQLTALEMQQVCFAFILEYERKGIK